MNNPNTVSFRKDENGDLEITLNDEGRAEIAEAIEDGKNVHSDDFFLDLIEHKLCNGWENIDGDLIGALTGAIILSDDAVRDSDMASDRYTAGTFYSNIATYQIESPVAIMLRDGKVIFSQAR